MIATIIILAYIANVFLNRWLNKILYKKNITDVVAFFWFIPIACTLSLLAILIAESIISIFKNNWFTGKYWDN